jgi:hypothetical protein
VTDDVGDKGKSRGGGGKARGGGGGGAATAAPPAPAPVPAPAAPAPTVDPGPASAGGVVGMSTLTREEKTVIDGYSAVDYKRINKVARGTFDGDADKAAEGVRKAAILDSAIAKATLARDVTLYRGARLSDFGGGVPAVGSTLSDRGFFSTTHDRHVAVTNFAGDAVLKINARKGTHAVDVTHVAGGLEKEVLFGRNSAMRVSSVKKVGGKYEIAVDMLP